jgi:hypothetical protein
MAGLREFAAILRDAAARLLRMRDGDGRKVRIIAILPPPPHTGG